MAVVSKELIWRLRRAEHAYTKKLLSTWGSLEGNPRGAEFVETQWGAMFFSKANPGNSIFNHASCLTGKMLDCLDDVEAAYKQRGIPPTVETANSELPDEMPGSAFTAMLERGYRPHQIEAMFYAEADLDFARPSKEVEVRLVREAKDVETFLELYLTGWEYPEDVANIWRSIGAKMRDDPGYSAFIALVEGTPAGCAQLYYHAGVGYLADACVLPDFRRKGCQRALFAARHEEARRRGADLVFSIAEIAGQSARNMENFGLRMASELWHWRKETA